VLEAAQILVPMIGNVGGEISVAAVGLDQGAIDVVAEVLRPEQGLLAVFPLLVDLAFRRIELALVDQALLA
jgi:hypothetical protein